jgi:hypothetical protein
MKCVYCQGYGFTELKECDHCRGTGEAHIEPPPPPSVFHVHKSLLDGPDFKTHMSIYLGPAPSKDFVTLYTHPPGDVWSADAD